MLPNFRVTDNRKAELKDFVWRQDKSQPAQLPLFPEVPNRKQVPILDMVDASNLPVTRQGGGVPMPLRLVVWVLMAVKLGHRQAAVPRPVPFKMRELVNGMHQKRWNRTNQWPTMRSALRSLGDYSIPIVIGGKAYSYHPVTPLLVSEEPALDDLIVLNVSYPPGLGSGPIVDLPMMGVLASESTGRWRAYIGAESVAWNTGVTRRKVAGRWFWSKDSDDYDVLTKHDRRRLAYGKDTKRRSQGVVDAAFENLPGLLPGLVVVSKQAINPRTGEGGWLVLPEAAAKAVKGD